MEDKDVKIKMSVCPKCGNAIRIAVEHTMNTQSKNEFAKEVMKYDLQVKTVSLEEYRSSNVEMYCKDVKTIVLGSRFSMTANVLRLYDGWD